MGILSVVVLILSLAITTVSIKKSEAFVGEQEINVTVIDIEEKDNFNRVTVKMKVGSTKIKARLFDYNNCEFTKGDNLTIKANLRKPSEDERSYTCSNGIYLVGSINEITQKSSGKGIYKLGYHLTSYIEKTIKQPLDSESAAPIIAFLTGNQDTFDRESEANIKACGTSHVMVVSGLHLGIICGALISLLNRVKANKKTVFLCGVITIFLILLVCGFHISAIRAAITYIVILVGGIIGRRADPLNSLGFAVFLIVVQNPFVVSSVSFLLSITATFGVIFVAPRLENVSFPKRNKSNLVVKGLTGAICVSVAALLCTTPVLVIAFGQLSLASVFVNVLITYAVTAALILTVLGILTSVIPFISKAIIVIAATIGRYVMWVLEVFGNKEQMLIYFNKTEAAVVSLVSIILILFIIFFGRQKKKGAEK